ncbi:hypothetical protein [Streptomyces sp. KS 21]|uniref:hypothetical protein n=1 Tax=Streptomyces sp. KS 21 TaxID=2485150 RepID=UPI001062D84A|nr:hypothetical protein [Streptomyces sp. KS 21]TDU73491.1 hypothetical protein EDD91_0035 [Streptomyces sp. KS 21]
MGAEIIEIDRPGEWPDDLTAYVKAAADAAGSVATYAELCEDGALGDFYTGLRELLAGRLLRTFHATRLLDYEVDDVKADGLRRLAPRLLQDRQDKALASGVITADERDALRESSVFKTERFAQFRLNKVCVVGNRQPLYDRPIGAQFSFWGGEAQYNGAGWNELASDRVKKLGRPALVVALLDASDPTVAILSYSELIYPFVGSFMGLPEVGCQIDYEADVPGDRIEAVWQPGDADYDQFPRFPQG